ncbi:MAG: hypothetical protein H7Z43_06130 [Clostridia bacterium]|nr:hypothetical protein [Deltaproteobacteria bacterium]
MENPYLPPRAVLGIPDAVPGPGEAPAATIAELRKARPWLYVMIAGGALGAFAQAVLTVLVSGSSGWFSSTYLVLDASALVAVWFTVRVSVALRDAVKTRALESVRRVIVSFTIAAFVGAGIDFLRNASSLVVRAGFASGASIAAFTSPPLATLTDSMRNFRLALLLSAIASVAATVISYKVHTSGSWYLHLYSATGLAVLTLEFWQIVSAGQFMSDPSTDRLDVWAKATRLRCCVQGIVTVASGLGGLSSAWYWYRMH